MAKINEGDSGGIQEFSDFLMHCEEAMKAGQSMGDLDIAETHCLVSTKLPSYSGIRWCRHAHEVQTKSKKIVAFKDFAKFITDEAELANDPNFLLNILKVAKRQMPNSGREGEPS